MVGIYCVILPLPPSGGGSSKFPLYGLFRTVIRIFRGIKKMTAILQSFSYFEKTRKKDPFYFFFEDWEKIGSKMAI
jgi:hypothetical protein